MSFLKNAGIERHQISINMEIFCHPNKVNSYVNNVREICQKLTAEEIEILAKVANNPTIKRLALDKAKQFV